MHALVRRASTTHLARVRALASVSASSASSDAPRGASARGVAAAAFAAAATATAYAALQTPTTTAQDPSRDACASDDDDRRARRCRRWAESRGASFSGVDARASGFGCGVFAVGDSGGERRIVDAVWNALRRTVGVDFRRERTLLKVPDAFLVNARTATADPTLGETYEALLRDGILDERTATMVFLVMERRKGEASPWKEYLESLPRKYDAPMNFSAEELDRELKGTTVYDAVAVQKVKLGDTFERSVRPAVRALSAKDASLDALPEVSRAEFEWAFQTYWTRALAIPVNGEIVESIVPVIDMVNHSRRGANARWERVGDAVALVTKERLKDGEEIFIDYGDTSVDALFFTHGFVPEDDDTSQDELVLEPPWINEPESERSRDVSRRVEALRAAGLPERLTLPARPPKRGDLRALDARTRETLRAWTTNPSSTTTDTAAAAADASVALRAALGARAHALRLIERDDFDRKTASKRELACDAYRRRIRTACDAWLDALRARVR